MLRKLLILLMLLTLLGTTAAGAADKLVVAILSSDHPRYTEAHRSMVKALALKGYSAPELEIMLQTPNPDPISWANSVRKAVALGADVVVAFGASVSQVAFQEKGRIPLVFVDVYGPVEAGIVKSMTSGDPTVCGITSKVPLQTLVKAAAAIQPINRLGVLYNSREIGSVVQAKELKRIAAQMGFAVVEFNASSSGTMEQLLSNGMQKLDFLFVSESSIACKSFDRITQRATQAGIPVLTTMPDAAQRGALLSLEIDPTEQGGLAAEFVARYISGRKQQPPVIASPRQIDLVVNLKVARKLDLSVPFQVLSAATRAIK
jgi:putative ABC transport system substrate-binding protein